MWTFHRKSIMKGLCREASGWKTQKQLEEKFNKGASLPHTLIAESLDFPPKILYIVPPIIRPPVAFQFSPQLINILILIFSVQSNLLRRCGSNVCSPGAPAPVDPIAIPLPSYLHGVGSRSRWHSSGKFGRTLTMNFQRHDMCVWGQRKVFALKLKSPLLQPKNPY